MINNLVSRMAEAQKLSVPQLKQAIQDGTLPPYIGIPLLQDKMKQEQTAKASQQVPQEPPIAHQVMEEASRRGVEQLPSNLPTEEMAHGGIVAFAGEDGSLVDEDNIEDYNDSIEEAEDLKAIHQAQALRESNAEEGIGALPNKGTGLSFREPIPAGASKGINADMARKHNVGNLRPVGFKYEGQIGVSPGGFAMFENREAGINALNHDIGVKLNRGLNTPEKFINVYAPKSDKNDTEAYIRNVSRALNIKPNQEIPNTPEARMVLAQAITRQEGAEKATARFAEGGIAHFDEGGTAGKEQIESDRQSIGDITDKGVASLLDVASAPIRGVTGAVNTSAIRPLRALTGYEIPYIGDIANLDPKVRDNPNLGKDSLSSMTPFYDTYVRGKEKAKKAEDKPVGPTDLELGRNNPTEKKEETPTDTSKKEPDMYQKMYEQFAQNAEERKKQKSVDAYMGLLTAGLGMMGGTSPYAMANIGQGSLAGIKQYSDSRKQAAAEQASDLKNQIALMRGQEISKANAATQAGLTQRANMAELERAQTNARNAAIKSMPPTLVDEGQKEAYIQKFISNDPVYRSLLSKNNIEMPTASQFDISNFKVVK